MTKRRAVIAVIVGVLVVAGLLWWGMGAPMPPFGPWKYLGSRYADNYHTHSCMWADQIRSANRVYFASKKAAEAKGYTPCPICIE